MKKTAFYFLFFAFFACFTLQAEERIAGTLDEVDLIISEMENDKGHNYGEHYFALNRGTLPVRLTIKLTDTTNAEDRLIAYTIILNPRERADLGTVTQKDVSKESGWKYQWSVEPDVKY